MYHVFYEDVAECGRVVLISDNMNVTIKPIGKHESHLGGRRCSYNGKHGLESICVTFQVVNVLVVLFTNIIVKIDGFRLNLSFN